jgi:hypothetical protein
MPNHVPRHLLILTWLALSATSASGQEPDPFIPERAAPVVAGLRSVAGYSTTHALTREWQTVDIYAVPNPDIRLLDGRPSIDYVARRTSHRGSIEWASSKDCLPLRNTLIWMSALIAPRIEIPGIAPGEAEPAGRRPITVYADGLVTTVWGRGTQPDHTQDTQVQIRSNGGLVADFGRAANGNLELCWRSDEPGA